MLWPVGVSYWDNICHVVFAPHVEHTKYDLVQYGRTRSARLPSSKFDGASGKQVPSDASVAGHLPPLPQHSYVAKHTATYHPTLPSSTCVFKHYCNLHLSNTLSVVIFSAITALQAPPTMDVFKQACPPQDNPLSIPMALTHHRFSECTMQTSVHFSSVRGMEQLKEKQEKFYAARQQRIQLQQGKLRKVNDLPKCCER